MSTLNMYISASAGSGKTYQLVNRFVALLSMQQLDAGRVDVTRLMAITFTRKAAGEFKSRILAELAKAASNEQAASSFWDERLAATLLAMGHQVTRPLDLQQFFTKMLRDVLGQFSQLQLSTIDSLLERMLRGLTPELGLNEVRIIDPQEEQLYIREALNASYLSNQSKDDIREISDFFIDSQSSDNSMSSPDRNFLKIIEEHHEKYLQSPHALWGGNAENMSEEELAIFGLCQDDVAPCLTEEEYKRQSQELNLLIEYQSGKFPKHVHKLNALKRIAQALSTKTASIELAKPTKAVPEPSLDFMARVHLYEYWQVCAQQGIDLDALIQTHHAYQWQQLLKRTQAIAQVVKTFESTYNKEIRQAGSLGFKDIANTLQDELNEHHLACLQERIDFKVEHWMLDEFQDTSHQQYHILENLLSSRAQGGDDGSIFMVGDTKQSIYQFRGGDPAIFINARSELFGIDDAKPESLKQSMPLNVSYRSAQEVLDLANLLFSPEQFPRIAEKSLKGSLKQWAKFRYEKHISANKKLEGCAEIWQLFKPDEKFNYPDFTQKDVLLHSIAAKLAEVRPKGCATPPSCAILVSTNADGKYTQNTLLELQEEYGFEGPIILNAKKLVGTDSVLGVALIQFFCWLNSPADKRSLSLLQLSPLWQRVEQLGGTNAWSMLRERWTDKGCTAILKLLLEKEGSSLISNQFLRQRKKIWMEAATSFDALGGTLSEWIIHMRKRVKNEDSQGSEISIMTIHNAKGLEFDFVFVPVFPRTKSFTDTRSAKMMCIKNNRGQDKAILLSPSPELLREFPQIKQKLVTPHLINEEIAGYCRLYVALTRAKHATYVMLPPTPRSDKESFASLLHQLSEEKSAPTERHELTHKDGHTMLGYCSLRLGNTNWYKHFHQAQTMGAPTASTPDTNYNYKFSSLPRSTPSGLDRDRQQDVQEAPTRTYLPISESKGAAFGSLVHGLFEQVSWLGDTLPDWSGVDASASATIEKSLNSEAWAPYFTKPKGEYQLYREQNIEALMDGRWVSGQIDRMVVHYGQGMGKAATAAHIMDFKTDANLSEAEGKEHYRAQMQAYRLMVAAALNLEPEQVKVTLLHCPAYGQAEAWDFLEGDWQ